MANIPGISGYIQPGVFARDRVVSRGVSLPGGLRTVCVLGEGLREETVVAAAKGGGEDGSASISPTGSGDGRFFRLRNYPVISGRTELRLSGTLLYGIQDQVDENGFDAMFDYRVDTETGIIELQSASIGDQDGSKYSASSMNTGNGTMVDGVTCGQYDDILMAYDENAPPERWTVKCVSVMRDSNGDPIPGMATFTATGSVSGQVYDASGAPYTFHSSYYTSSAGAISGNLDECLDGFVVADNATNDGTDSGGTVFGAGTAVLRDGDSTPTTTDTFTFAGDLVSHGQVMAGDNLCVDGYIGAEIDDIEYDSGTDTTTITLTTDSFSISTEGDETFETWDIRATNLLIDDPDEDPDTGSFTSADVGKVVALCGSDAAGLYTVSAVTGSRRLRLHAIDDEDSGFPDLEGVGETGLAATSNSFHMLETNGVLIFGIEEGTVPFEVGDKFYVDVDSRVLRAGDSLVAKYIAELDLNDPQFFTSANDLQTKHGSPSTTNTLALGAQMSFENGSPGILAIQCRPPIPRRTSVTLLEEVDSNGDGGFSGCYSGGTASADNCEVDDLRFTIPRPITGLRNGRPDSDSRVNIFVVRDDEETQIFPNKVDFYNSQLESPTMQLDFISSSDYTFSYTLSNTNFNVLGDGVNGAIGEEVDDNGDDRPYFETAEFDFDGEHVGFQITITSMEESDGTVHTSQADISQELYGTADDDPILTINSVVSDGKVYVTGAEDLVAGLGDYVDVKFFVSDPSDTTNVDAALLLHKDIVDSGVLQEGDGIRISYIDENDADFFDTNWFDALEMLEAHDAQVIVPLPLQAISSVFRATVNHCENMSTIANRKERMALIGSQMGVTAAALIGQEEVAVEDIGILEGIQGDDPEEILDGNTEDLVNYTLSDNYTSNRAVYFWPDEIVRNVNGTNTMIHGFYMAAAASGRLSATQNVAIPLTYKTLSGFSILRDKLLREVTLNALGNVGATVVTPVTGGGKVLAGRTTSNSGFVEDEEISVMFIRDRVKQVLRSSLKGFLGGVQDENTNVLVGARVRSIMAALASQGLVSSYKDIAVEKDKVDPRQINVFLRFSPAYPINYIFIDIEVGVF